VHGFTDKFKSLDTHHSRSMFDWMLTEEGESRDWQTENLNVGLVLILQRGKIETGSLIFTLLFDCNGISNQSVRLN
jgi:hypothetical protein